MEGGAWPFLVGGVICLVDSDNERDFFLIITRRIVPRGRVLLYLYEDLYSQLLNRRNSSEGRSSNIFLNIRGTGGDPSRTKISNNRSVMPLDVLGCTRATMNGAACFSHSRKEKEII